MKLQKAQGISQDEAVAPLTLKWQMTTAVRERCYRCYKEEHGPVLNSANHSEILFISISGEILARVLLEWLLKVMPINVFLE